MTPKPTILSLQLTRAECDGAMDAISQLLARKAEINSGMEEILQSAMRKLQAAEPEDVTIRPQIAVMDTMANLETWEERCVGEAIDEYGLRDPGEIRDHVAAAQTDNDYLIGQDETLERLIGDARRARGTARGLDRVIEEALADLEQEPDEDGPSM